MATIPLAWTVKLAVAAWVGASWLTAYRGLARQAGRGGTCEIVVRDDEIDVRNASGSWHRGRVRSGSFVAPWLTIIRWRPDRGRFDRAIVILPDMLESDRFRELRVLLRWG